MNAEIPISVFKTMLISWSDKQYEMNCCFLLLGRVVAFSKWYELTLGTNCRFLEFGTNCRLWRIVAWDELSLHVKTSLTELWLITDKPGSFKTRLFVNDNVLLKSFTIYISSISWDLEQPPEILKQAGTGPSRRHI